MSLIHKITNLNILEKFDKNQRPYYLFFDNDIEKGKSNMWAGFVPFNIIGDTNWEAINRNYREIKEVEFEYETGEKGSKITKLLSISFIDHQY